MLLFSSTLRRTEGDDDLRDWLVLATRLFSLALDSDEGNEEDSVVCMCDCDDEIENVASEFDMAKKMDECNYRRQPTADNLSRRVRVTLRI